MAQLFSLLLKDLNFSLLIITDLIQYLLYLFHRDFLQDEIFLIEFSEELQCVFRSILKVSRSWLNCYAEIHTFVKISRSYHVMFTIKVSKHTYTQGKFDTG